MKLNELAKAMALVKPNHSICLYGPPKVGKTRLAASAVRIPEVNRIFWFDCENGMETMLHMGLTEAEMEKITIFKIRDTRDNPIAIETILRAFSKDAVQICDMHGKCVCAACMKDKLPSTRFKLSECTHNDLVVIDSGSQLGDSALAACCLGKDVMFKPGFDEYAIMGKWLGDILTTVQQATHTNFVVLTHEIAIEDDHGKDMFFPLIGTRNFCMKAGKYFGTTAYLDKKMNKHVAGSGSTYRNNVITGSRVNALLENSKDPTMRDILIEGGILQQGDYTKTEARITATIHAEEAPVQVVDPTQKESPVGIAARIAAIKAEQAAKRAAKEAGK